MKPIIAIAAAGLLAACATAAPPAILETPFQASDYAWSQAQGTNAVMGNAVMRTVAGDAKTCAALPVSLIPDGAYTRERMMRIYGNTERGFRSAAQGGVFFQNDTPAFRALVRETICDAQGNFTFQGLPDGEYYVVSLLTWGVPMQYYTSTQGGMMMQRVAVSGGETRRIVLSQ